MPTPSQQYSRATQLLQQVLTGAQEEIVSAFLDMDLSDPQVIACCAEVMSGIAAREGAVAQSLCAALDEHFDPDELLGLTRHFESDLGRRQLIAEMSIARRMTELVAKAIPELLDDPDNESFERPGSIPAPAFQLVEAFGGQDGFERGLVDALALFSADDGFSPDDAERFAAAWRGWWPVFESMTAANWALRFTRPELEEILAFATSPIGRTHRAIKFDLMDSFQSRVGALCEEVATEVMPRYPTIGG